MRAILLLICTLIASGCVRGGVHFNDTIGVPFPRIDQPLHSVESYNTKYSIDLYKIPHDLNAERRSWQEAEANCSKVYSKISQKLVRKNYNCKSKSDIFNKFKTLGNNDYTIECPKLPKPQRQKEEVYCWAAASQFIIATKYDKTIDQDTIVSVIIKPKTTDKMELAGSITDALSALGVGGLSLFPNGSYELLESLGNGLPVMVGLHSGDPNELGHIVVIVGARFSFTSEALPFCLNCSDIVFSEFSVYDPWTGDITTWPATRIEKEIDFFIAYN